MYQGKTKRGVDIKSTRSIKRKVSAPTWLLVMDSAHARLYESKKKTSLELIREWKNPQARKRSRKLVSDRPGRSFESYTKAKKAKSGPVRHALSRRLTPQQNATEAFVTRLASAIGTCKRKNAFKKLILVAEPHLLGSIRKNLDSVTKKSVKAEYKKDLAWLGESEIQARIQRYLL